MVIACWKPEIWCSKASLFIYINCSWQSEEDDWSSSDMEFCLTSLWCFGHLTIIQLCTMSFGILCYLFYIKILHGDNFDWRGWLVILMVVALVTKIMIDKYVDIEVLVSVLNNHGGRGLLMVATQLLMQNTLTYDLIHKRTYYNTLIQFFVSYYKILLIFYQQYLIGLV